MDEINKPKTAEQLEQERHIVELEAVRTILVQDGWLIVKRYIQERIDLLARTIDECQLNEIDKHRGAKHELVQFLDYINGINEALLIAKGFNVDKVKK